MVAMAKARRFADVGKKVLLLCFNSMLSEWLTQDLPVEYHGKIIIKNYHALCSDWVKKAKLAWPQNLDPASNFWSDKAPALLEKAIDLLPNERFDAVVVDEGQDFHPLWWDSVELISKNPLEDPLYIFMDPAQQLFHVDAPTMPDLGKPFDLPCNCRNTNVIAAMCGKIIKKKIPVRVEALQGQDPRIVHAPTPEAQRAEVENQIKGWLSPTAGLKTKQIAVVTRTSVENSSCASLVRIAGKKVSDHLSEWRNGESILLTSLGKFKGLEADALILVDVIEPDPNAGPQGFRPAHYYVACSRAKHLLTVLKLEHG